MHKKGGSYEVINGEPVAIDEKRREQLIKGGGAPAPAKPSRKSDTTASTMPAGGDDVSASKSTQEDEIR